MLVACRPMAGRDHRGGLFSMGDLLRILRSLNSSCRVLISGSGASLCNSSVGRLLGSCMYGGPYFRLFASLKRGYCIDLLPRLCYVVNGSSDKMCRANC